MTIANKPDEKIFATNAKRGEVSDFPDLLRGWGITFDQTEGIPPMEWFNALFQRNDNALAYLLQRGIPEWTATQHYPTNAYVQHNGKCYRALKESQNQNPTTANSSYWKQWAMDYSEASTTQQGIVQLDSSINSNAENKAATPKAVKTAYDRGTEGVNKANTAQAAAERANANANNRVLRTGDTMTGVLTLPKIITTSNNAGGENIKLGDDVWIGDDAVAHGFRVKGCLDNNQGYIKFGNSERFGWNGSDWKVGEAKLNHSAQNYLYATANSGGYGGTNIHSAVGNFRYECEGSHFKLWKSRKNSELEDYTILFPEREGTVALKAEPHEGHGPYLDQYRTAAPFMVTSSGSKTYNAYHPFIKGRVRYTGAYGVAFSFGYTTRTTTQDGWGFGAIHLIEDNGLYYRWEFRHGGDFKSQADVITGSGKSLNNAIQRIDCDNNIQLRWNGSSLQLKVDNTEFGSLLVNERVKVLTGEIAHGGTIPLPSGFSQEQCCWIATPRHLNDDVSSSDIRYFTVHANSNRVVTCLIEGKVSSTSRAQYLIIGIK